MIGRVLVPVDGSELSARALPYAVRVASAARAGLTLLHAQLPVTVRKEPPYDPEPLAERLRAEGLEVETLVRHAHRDETADVICQTAKSREASLIVMATHGRGGLGRWIYGSVADRVLRRASVPVLLVPTSIDHDWPTDRPPRILVPLDGSPFAEEVVAPATELTLTLGADLLLMRAVMPDVRPIFPNGNTNRPHVPRVDEATARAYLWEVATRIPDTGQLIDVRVVLGAPSSAIPRIARNDQVDLIAMTTRARGGVSRWALGSVATDTLRRSHLPLLLLQPAALRGEEPVPARLGEAVTLPEPEGGATTVTLSPHEQQIVSEALELLMFSTQGDTELTTSLRDLLEKVRPSASAVHA